MHLIRSERKKNTIGQKRDNIIRKIGIFKTSDVLDMTIS